MELMARSGVVGDADLSLAILTYIIQGGSDNTSYN